MDIPSRLMKFFYTNSLILLAALAISNYFYPMEGDNLIITFAHNKKSSFSAEIKNYFPVLQHLIEDCDDRDNQIEFTSITQEDFEFLVNLAQAPRNEKKLLLDKSLLPEIVSAFKNSQYLAACDLLIIASKIYKKLFTSAYHLKNGVENLQLIHHWAPEWIDTLKDTQYEKIIRLLAKTLLDTAEHSLLPKKNLTEWNFSPQTSYRVIYHNNEVRLVNPQDIEEVWLKNVTLFTPPIFNEKGTRIAIGLQEVYYKRVQEHYIYYLANNIRIKDLVTKQERSIVYGEDKKVINFIFTPGSSKLIICLEGREFLLHNFKDSATQSICIKNKKLKQPPKYWGQCLAFNQKKNLLVSNKNFVEEWDMHSYTILRKIYLCNTPPEEAIIALNKYGLIFTSFKNIINCYGSKKERSFFIKKLVNESKFPAMHAISTAEGSNLILRKNLTSYDHKFSLLNLEKLNKFIKWYPKASLSHLLALHLRITNLEKVLPSYLEPYLKDIPTILMPH